MRLLGSILVPPDQHALVAPKLAESEFADRARTTAAAGAPSWTTNCLIHQVLEVRVVALPDAADALAELAPRSVHRVAQILELTGRPYLMACREKPEPVDRTVNRRPVSE